MEGPTGAPNNRLIDIKSFTLDELTERLESLGKARFRATQIFKWLYKRDAAGFEEMTDLSMALRQELAESFAINRFPVLDSQKSEDGTEKLLLGLPDGENVEVVLIPGEHGRLTLCISSQIGCKLKCGFCRTGTMGFTRDLTSGEIVEQVQAAGRYLGGDTRERITNLVLMGMGEPLLNYDNVVRAIRTMYTEHGLNYSSRKITISTAGVLPAMERLGREIEVSVAISLHAVDNETRSMLMPINKKYPIEALMEVCRNYPLGTRRRLTFEYLLIHGVNDSLEDAKKLAKLMRTVKSKVNLIPFNRFEGCSWEPPDWDHILAFQKVLLDGSVTTIIRKSRGEDILAACGQLKSRHQRKS